MQYDTTYNGATEILRGRVEEGEDYLRSVGKLLTGIVIENSFLYEYDDIDLKDAERLNVVLPVIKWEIKSNNLTPQSKQELYFYYDDYKKGKLDGILAEYEAELVLHDLTECYFKVFDSYPASCATVQEGPYASLPKHSVTASENQKNENWS